MIKDLKFEFDLDDIMVDTRFLSELCKITNHYDTRTSIEEVEAVKILIEKINVVNVLNWQPYFHAMALQCDIQLPISVEKDFCFLIQQIIAEARKVGIQAANYGFIVSCCNKICCLTGDKKVDRDRERGDKKVDLLTCDKKVSK